MKIVVAMDSFKDSLSAVEACRAAADGIASLVAEAELVLKPMADGGEGTSSAMIAAGDGQWIEKTVTGPLPGTTVKAGFAWFDGEQTALVEMASASGMTLLSRQQKKPLKTTTYGTGELIAAAMDHGEPCGARMASNACPSWARRRPRELPSETQPADRLEAHVPAGFSVPFAGPPLRARRAWSAP